MGIMGFLRGVIGAEEPTTYVEGTIVDGPTVEGPTAVGGERRARRVVTFRLDTCLQVRFRQVVSALAPERRRGERVRVHYLMRGPVAEVQWVERV